MIAVAPVTEAKIYPVSIKAGTEGLRSKFQHVLSHDYHTLVSKLGDMRYYATEAVKSFNAGMPEEALSNVRYILKALAAAEEKHANISPLMSVLSKQMLADNPSEVLDPGERPLNAKPIVQLSDKPVSGGIHDLSSLLNPYCSEITVKSGEASPDILRTDHQLVEWTVCSLARWLRNIDPETKLEIGYSSNILSFNFKGNFPLSKLNQTCVNKNFEERFSTELAPIAGTAIPSIENVNEGERELANNVAVKIPNLFSGVETLSSLKKLHMVPEAGRLPRSV